MTKYRIYTDDGTGRHAIGDFASAADAMARAEELWPDGDPWGATPVRDDASKDRCGYCGQPRNSGPCQRSHP